jgi:hypothetical protein
MIHRQFVGEAGDSPLRRSFISLMAIILEKAKKFYLHAQNLKA